MLSKVFPPSSNASEKREREKQRRAAEVRCDSEVMCDECDVKTTGQPTGAERDRCSTAGQTDVKVCSRVSGDFFSFF